MGILKTRQNKKFGYEPRYYKHDGEGSPYQIEHKFDKFRKTVGSSNGMKGNFKNAWEELRGSKSKSPNRIIFFVVALFLLIFLYIIDFDLSIFVQQP